MRTVLLMLSAMVFAVGAAQGQTVFDVVLDGAQVPNSSTKSGSGRVTLNDAETEITVSVTHTVATVDVVAGHIHQGAPGVNGAAIFTLAASGASPISQVFSISPSQVTVLKAGGYYINIHTAAFPGVTGEIRGQVLPRPDEVDVSITEPVSTGDTVSLTVYTPDGEAPAIIPVGVQSTISDPIIVRGASSVESVVTAVGGTLNNATHRISGEVDSDAAVLTNVSGDDSEYVAVLNAATLDFQSATRTVSGLFAQDFIRTMAMIDGYYILGVGEIGISVNIRDLAEIDTDENGIPDADTLAGGDITLISRNGTVTLIHSLDSVGRGTTQTEVSHFYDTANGPVEVTLTSPTLSALQTADDAFLDYDTGRLIVSIGVEPSDLLDGPADVAPLSEFDLVDGTDPLPAPQNLFVRVAIAVATTSLRGTPTAWTFVNGALPGGLDFVGTLSGPGIADALQGGTDVGVYTYAVTLSQDGQDIVANGDQDGWAEVDSLQLNNNDSEDDAADARIVAAADGDDTIRATFSVGSAIFGSNVAPSAESDDDDGGGSFCFIATAAYGTPMAAQIGSLRSVRDSYLIGTPLGAAFVDTYYRLSPPIAGVVSESAALRQGVRIALSPVIAISGWLLASPGSFAAAGIAVMLLCSGTAARALRRLNRN